MVTITGILNLVMNFLALTVLSELNQNFLKPFLTPRQSVFAEMELPIRNYRKSRYIIRDEFEIDEAEFYKQETYLLQFLDVKKTETLTKV
jgi:hypothetical protein